MVGFVEAEFARFTRDLNRTEQRFLVAATRAAYKHIMRQWPMWSGYSKANNRVSITGRPIARREPNKRVVREGAHFAKAASVESAQLAKLSRIPISKSPKPRTIIIGNSVDYAADLGEDGSARGFHIYLSAVNMARAAIKGV